MPSPEIPSARVLANRARRIQWNRAALDELEGGMADGLLNMGLRIALDAAAHAPKDPEAAAARGVPMLKDTGFVQVWAKGKRVGGVWQKRPKGGAVPPDQVVLFVGFNSPIAHLLELGTVKMNARPFLLPAFNRAISGLESVVVPAMGKRMAGARASAWARAPRTPRATR